jgi:hypothetical protein
LRCLPTFGSCRGGNALGIGGLGTKGARHGRGGYGEVDLGGRGKDDTVFVPGRTTVVGGLSREVINRVIQKHYNEIKYCYEEELSKDPALYGKVTMLFMIDGTGAGHSSRRRWACSRLSAAAQEWRTPNRTCR